MEESEAATTEDSPMVDSHSLPAAALPARAVGGESSRAAGKQRAVSVNPDTEGPPRKAARAGDFSSAAADPTTSHVAPIVTRTPTTNAPGHLAHALANHVAPFPVRDHEETGIPFTPVNLLSDDTTLLRNRPDRLIPGELLRYNFFHDCSTNKSPQMPQYVVLTEEERVGRLVEVFKIGHEEQKCRVSTDSLDRIADTVQYTRKPISFFVDLTRIPGARPPSVRVITIQLEMPVQVLVDRAIKAIGRLKGHRTQPIVSSLFLSGDQRHRLVTYEESRRLYLTKPSELLAFSQTIVVLANRSICSS